MYIPHHLTISQDREQEPRFNGQAPARGGFDGGIGRGGGFGGGFGGGHGGGGGNQLYVSNVRPPQIQASTIGRMYDADPRSSCHSQLAGKT